jgi:uncharacterized membrane protein
MSHQSKMAGVVFIGALHLISGIAGILIGGTPAQAGWVLVVVGLLLVGLAWRETSVSERATG